MWPVWPEMTRDECRKCLRSLELDAYGSMVSVLRAQGPFTNEKQKLLQELAKVLHISNERHRAEVRRAVNDEKLATIAEQLNGPNTGIDWTLEGRRTIPLLPRLKARSGFTTLANSLSLATAFANEKKSGRCDIVGQSGNSTVTETESRSINKIEESLSTDIEISNFENMLDNNTTLQGNCNLIEDEKANDKDMLNKISEKPKVLSQKRKSPSPLPTAPPNKVLMIQSEQPNHTLQTIENKQMSQALQVTKHQNFSLITVIDNENPDSKESATIADHENEHVIATTSICTSNPNNPKMITNIEQNKISTKVVPAITSCILSINKMHSSKDTQLQDNTNNTQKIQVSDNISSNLSPAKSSMNVTPHTIIQNTRVSSPRLTQSMPVYPGTTVSSGPGPPQIKQQVPITLMCKKLPSEQITTFDQSTAKTGFFPKKVVNMPHYTNIKPNKTNVIVIQKAKAVTLSHAGKEVIGKVIVGGKNLCVTSPHNTNSINLQPHYASLNNGDQTKTTLPTANSSQNAEFIKANVKSGKATVVSVLTHLRHDVSENKVFSQLFDSSALRNVESKTVLQNVNARLPKDENSDKNAMDRESTVKTNPIQTSEEKRKNDVNVSINSQVANLVESSQILGNKGILVRPKQVHGNNVEDGIEIEKFDGNADVFDTMLESTNKDLQSFHILDNDENYDVEKSSRSIAVNQIDEHNNS